MAYFLVVSMSCDEIKEVIKCGEPFVFEFVVEQNEAAFSIANYTAQIDLRSTSKRGPVINTWIDGDAEIFRNDEGGLLTLTLPPSFTAGLNFKVAYLDLLLLTADDSDGLRSDPVMLTLDRGVTQNE